MNIISKFEIGDYVWINYEGKYYEGEVLDIPAWEKDSKRGFLYYVKIDTGAFIRSVTLYEHEIYSDKDEIMKNIFVNKNE